MDLSPEALAYLEAVGRDEWVTPSSEWWADLAPHSDDPASCRWCGGRVVILQDSQQTRYCQARGCATEPKFLCRCVMCSRKFRSGDLKADVCWDCHARENAEIRAAGVSVHGPGNFLRDSRPRRA